MPKTIEEYEKVGIRQKLDEEFIAALSNESRIVVEEKLKNNDILKTLYEHGRLYVGSQYRIEKTFSFSKETRRVPETEVLKLSEDTADFDQLIIDTFSSIKDTSTDSFSDKYNVSAIAALTEAEIGAESQPFSFSIEIFPDRSTEEGTRSDYFDISANIMKICPREFPETDIPAPGDFVTLIAHETAHAIDFMINDSNSSAQALRGVIETYCPKIDNSNIRIVRELLQKSTVLYPKGFGELYKIAGIIEEKEDDIYEFNPDAEASCEFVSHCAENISRKLSKSRTIEDFLLRMTEYFEDHSGEMSISNECFAFEVMRDTLSQYSEVMKGHGQDEVFQVVDKIISSKIEELNNIIVKEKGGRLEKLNNLVKERISQVSSLEDQNSRAELTILQKYQQDLNDVKEIMQESSTPGPWIGKLHIICNEILDNEDLAGVLELFNNQFIDDKMENLINAELKNQDLSQLIEGSEELEDIVTSIDENVGVSEEYNKFFYVNDFSPPPIEKIMSMSVCSDSLIESLVLNHQRSPIEQSVSEVLEEPNDNSLQEVNESPLQEAAKKLGKGLKYDGDGNIKVNKQEALKVVETFAKTIEGLNLSEEEKNAQLETIVICKQQIEKQFQDEHLKRAEKFNLGSEEKPYNLKEAIEAVNKENVAVNKAIKKIEVASIVESSINMKAIDALPIRAIGIDNKMVTSSAEQATSVPSQLNTIKIVAEDNHSKQHGDHVHEFEQQISEGVIGENTVIFLERKAYGDNLGMQDVIKLANIIQHNDDNKEDIAMQITIPQEIKDNPMILADAQLYKVARNHGVKVIGLEGGNLSAQKDTVEYNENREQYMAAVITEVQSKGYNVVVNIGSAHKDGLEERLEAMRGAESVGLNQMPRKLTTKQKIQEPQLSELVNSTNGVNLERSNREEFSKTKVTPTMSSGAKVPTTNKISDSLKQQAAAIGAQAKKSVNTNTQNKSSVVRSASSQAKNTNTDITR